MLFGTVVVVLVLAEETGLRVRLGKRLGGEVGMELVVFSLYFGSRREVCFFWFSISCCIMLRPGVPLEVNWADGRLSGLSLGFHGGDRIAWVAAGVDRLTAAMLHM